ncbi:AAA family ATPase [Alkalimarinus coralli]|uniref:AAA family ATPase n=1 Tax=Alkalimarinus coralli TaxID=2935863 RepID=UPI00202AC7B5|nr:SMC family ATPase [Alkalimarinus coralli]
MRPIKLTIQAFGPFAGKEEIDFAALGDNPLFLINGPTGAGKSSILDAICFALYGHTTGKEREPSQMRCDHAAPDLLTEITLEFSLGERRYRIRRAPTQERPKSRGEGTTTHQTQAQFWQLKPEGDELLVPQKAQEATHAIETITGLNVEQFRQVMVLPQGKFRDFLMADSSQREVIFSRLFQTQIYKRIEDALKSKASTIRKEAESLQNQIKGILQGADLSAESDVQEQLDELAPQLASTTEQKDQAASSLAKSEKALEAGKILSKAFLALDSTRQSLNQLEAQKADIDSKKNRLTRAQSAQKIEHLQTTLKKCTHNKEQLNRDIAETEKALVHQQGNLASAKSALEQAEKERNPLDQLKEQLAELRKLEPKISQLADATSLSQTTQASLKEATLNHERLQTQLNQLISQISSAEERVTKLRASCSILPDKQRQLDNLRLLGQQRANLDKRIDEQNAVRQAHHNREQALAEVTARYERQETQVKQLEFAWHSGQAALLAAELKQNEPCPVCGSTQHPSPANTNTQSNPVTKKEIDDARAELAKLQQQLTSAQNQITETATQLNNIQSLLLEQQRELGENQHKSTNQLREEWKQLNDEVSALKQQHKEQGQLELELQSLTQQRSTTEQQREQALVALQQAQQNHSSAKQDEQYIQQALPEAYRQPGALAKAVQQLEDRIRSITTNYEQAVASFDTARQSVTQVSATLEQQHSQAKAFDVEYKEATAHWESALSSSEFENQQDYESALKTESEQAALTKEIDQYLHQLSGCKATLAQQQSQLEQQPKPDIEKLQAERDKLEAASATALESWKKIDNRHQQLTAVQNKLKQAHESNHALEAEYKIYGTLSDVANGQTGNKLSLQRFVLSVLLDDVLIEASHRLSVMSKGRYLLIRKEQRAKGNKASGLELEVEDAYTGKTRSVATLSGGESFMAALSLALGLSDVVQAYAGGIKLETLFIDEGFGSLDQESLDLAIKTLIDLQSSGRMIGIISHVSELREQMALRIDVHSSSSGSRITLQGA